MYTTNIILEDSKGPAPI